MNKKNLSIPFNAPLHPNDTELQTYVAELITRIYVGITDYRMSVPFHRKIVFVKSRHELGKSNMPSLKAKLLNYCLPYLKCFGLQCKG